MTPDRLAGLLGLCRRAGRLVTGQESVLAAVRTGPKSRVALAVFTADASERTRKQLCDKCTFYGVPCRELPMTGEALARATGKTASLTTAAIADRGFAGQILRLLQDDGKPAAD